MESASLHNELVGHEPHVRGCDTCVAKSTRVTTEEDCVVCQRCSHPVAGDAVRAASQDVAWCAVLFCNHERCAGCDLYIGPTERGAKQWAQFYADTGLMCEGLRLCPDKCTYTRKDGAAFALTLVYQVPGAVFAYTITASDEQWTIDKEASHPLVLDSLLQQRRTDIGERVSKANRRRARNATAGQLKGRVIEKHERIRKVIVFCNDKCGQPSKSAPEPDSGTSEDGEKSSSGSKSSGEFHASDYDDDGEERHDVILEFQDPRLDHLRPPFGLDDVPDDVVCVGRWSLRDVSVVARQRPDCVYCEQCHRHAPVHIQCAECRWTQCVSCADTLMTWRLPVCCGKECRAMYDFSDASLRCDNVMCGKTIDPRDECHWSNMPFSTRELCVDYCKGCSTGEGDSRASSMRDMGVLAFPLVPMWHCGPRHAIKAFPI